MVRFCRDVELSAAPPSFRRKPCATTNPACLSGAHGRPGQSVRSAVWPRPRPVASTGRHPHPSALSRRIRPPRSAPTGGRRWRRWAHRTPSRRAPPEPRDGRGPARSAPPHSATPCSRRWSNRQSVVQPVPPPGRRSGRAVPPTTRGGAPHRSPGRPRSRCCTPPNRCCGRRQDPGWWDAEAPLPRAPFPRSRRTEWQWPTRHRQRSRAYCAPNGPIVSRQKGCLAPE